jgi:hypothetical protein
MPRTHVCETVCDARKRTSLPLQAPARWSFSFPPDNSAVPFQRLNRTSSDDVAALRRPLSTPFGLGDSTIHTRPGSYASQSFLRESERLQKQLPGSRLL